MEALGQPASRPCDRKAGALDDSGRVVRIGISHALNEGCKLFEQLLERLDRTVADGDRLRKRSFRGQSRDNRVRHAGDGALTMIPFLMVPCERSAWEGADKTVESCEEKWAGLR